MAVSEPRGRGRPSDPGTDERVRRAFLSLVGERGLAATTMDDIARASGVSKPTLYARYGSKNALCATTIRVLFARVDDVELDSLDPQSAVRRILEGATRIVAAGPRRSLLAILGWMAEDAELERTWRGEVFVPRRAQVGRAFARAVALGELDPAMDVDVATDMLIGPVFFRILIAGDALETAAIARIVHAVWRAFAVKR